MEQQPVQQPCRTKLCEKMKSWKQNYPVRLAWNQVFHIILAVLGILTASLDVTIIRIVSGIIGHLAIRKKSPVYLVTFSGLMVANLISTPIQAVKTLGFGALMALDGHCFLVKITILVLIFVHFVTLYVNQICGLKHAIRFYRAEKAKHQANPTPATDPEAEVIQEIEIPETNLVQRQPLLRHENLYPYPEPQPMPVVQQEMEVTTEPQYIQPVVVPQAIDDDEYREHQKHLSEMGFNDYEKNKVLLVRFNGNIQQCVQNYVSQM